MLLDFLPARRVHHLLLLFAAIPLFQFSRTAPLDWYPSTLCVVSDLHFLVYSFNYLFFLVSHSLRLWLTHSSAHLEAILDLFFTRLIVFDPDHLKIGTEFAFV